jgi:hypothetical protein
MKKIILILICLSYSFLNGQVVCKGRLLDASNKQPVEFANIGIVGKNVGTVTNEKGEYSFIVPDSLINESIKISMLGYKSKTESAKNLAAKTQIQLEQNATQLNEVTIRSKKLKVKILGNETKTNMVTGGFTSNKLGAEMAIKLSIKKPQTQVRRVMVNINVNSLDTVPVFRCNIYSVGKDGFPSENLLSQNIIIVPKQKVGYVDFDLTPYKIFVDDDVFISLEWVKDLGDARGLAFSTKIIGASTYYRQTSQGKWEKTNSIGVGLHAEVAY